MRSLKVQLTRSTSVLASLLLGASCLTFAGGCTRSLVTEPVPTDYDRTDPAAEVVFFHNLSTSGRVSNDEALHALVLLAQDEDLTTNYDERLAFAKDRGWVMPGFNEPADIVARKGMVADSIVRILGIRGGVMMQMLGPTPRYAIRELAELGVIPAESGERQAMSGAELLGIVGRARDQAIIMKMRELQRKD